MKEIEVTNSAGFVIMTVAFLFSFAFNVLYTLSPPIECGRQPHHVYVVDHRACLPIEAFTPAVEPKVKLP